MFLEAVDAISHMPEARGWARLVLERVPTKIVMLEEHTRMWLRKHK